MSRKQSELEDETVIHGEVLFAVDNEHEEEAPSVLWGETRYRAYFENEFGDQWILFDYDLDPEGVLKLGPTVILSGGDVDWSEREFSLDVLREPKIEIDLILSASERAWLTACFTAVRAYRYPDDRRPVEIVTPFEKSPTRRRRRS